MRYCLSLLLVLAFATLTVGQTSDVGDRVRRYAEGLLRRYDAGKNGMLEESEWRDLGANYLKADKDGDKVITLDELTNQLAAFSEPTEKSSPRADAPRQVLEFEIVFAEWRGSSDQEAAAPSLDQIDIAALEKSGALSVLQRIKLTGLSHHTASAQIGGQRARVTSVATGRGGFAPQRQVNYEQFGTMITLRPVVEASGRIVTELEVSRSAPSNAEDSPVLGENEAGEKIRADGLDTTTIKTAVAAESGKTVVVNGHSLTEGNKQDGKVVLLTVKVLSGDGDKP